MQLLLLLVVALTITVALIPPLANAAGRFRLLDRPGERKVHAAPMPRIGGIAMAIGTLVPLTVMASQPGEWAAIYAGVAILLIMGLLDDRYDLAWPWKLGAQIIACGLAIVAGDVSIDSATLTERIELPTLVSTVLSLVFLVGVTNAINLSDGLDGLAGGTTLLSVIAIGWISFSAGNIAVAATTAALTGALLGFLRFNTHPARVFMGDSGSQVLGFLAGVVAIKATQGAESTVSAALPLLLLAWPILDTLTVMTERIREGRSPFSADRRHFHHRLLALGFDHYQAVLIIYGAQCALFVMAFVLRYESDIIIGATFVTFAALTIGSLEGARLTGWRWQRGERQASRIAKKVQWLAQNDVVARTCRAVLLIALGVYGAVVAAAPLTVSMDVAALALALAAILALVAVSGKRMTSVMRFVFFVAAAMLVYLDQRGLGALPPDSIWVLLLFGALGAVVLLRFRVSGERRFSFTTLDALVLFVALMAPVFAGDLSAQNVGFGILKLVALGYALEFAFEGDEHARWAAGIAALLLSAVAMRGIVPM